MARRALRVGIDVGGTFTDLVAAESWSGRIVTRKVPSTPKEPHRAVVHALTSLLDEYAERPAIELIAHSTTIATNALLGQIGLELPRVALVTTRGFRDVIEIGRQNRSEVYNLFVERPRPLVAREDRLSVSERIDYRGNVLRTLAERSIEEVCDALRERGVAAVAVCLLNSYANDAHERRLADAMTAALPGVRIARSSEVDPEYREYERFSTTVVNAVLAPIVESYLERVMHEFVAIGIDAPLYVMRSDGGMAAARQIRTLPAALLESGPASGAVAAAALGRRIGASRLLSFDMGGTTAKAGTISDGVAQVAHEFEAAGTTHSGRAAKGSGYPVRFPFVDLAEVSAGGGTIAWIDDATALRVGPISAGADPGPACYGISDRPTVTDANVVLGRLHQHHLLGGAFPIDASRARDSVGVLARRLDNTIEATAADIVALADNAMAKALRIVTVERGMDPRDFVLVAFGGGGPLHACALGDELGIRRVFLPPHPGLFSARGLLDADLQVTDVRALLCAAHDVDADAVETFFVQSEARAGESLVAQGAKASTIAFHRQYDARYRGQSFELTIEHDREPDVVARLFHKAHLERYGYDVRTEVVELVNARLAARASVAAGTHRLGAFGVGDARGRTSPDGAAERPTARPVWIAGAFVEAPVFARTDLMAANRIEGPAIVEEYDSTTYVAPAWSLTVEDELIALDRKR